MQRQFFAHFDGSNDYGEISGSPLDFTGDVTAEIVFRVNENVDDTNGRHVLYRHKADGTVEWGISFEHNSSFDFPFIIRFAGFNGSVITNINTGSAGLGLDVGRWYTVTCVISGSTAYIYIDGVLIRSGSSGGMDDNTGGYITVGASGALGNILNHAPVDVAEIRIWDYARTSDQILNNYDKSVIGQDAVGLWVFSTIADLSGGGNNIDLQNGSALVDSPVQYVADPRLNPPVWPSSRNLANGGMQIITGAEPPGPPPDPTKPALFYPSGGGALQQWDISSQSWV